MDVPVFGVERGSGEGEREVPDFLSTFKFQTSRGWGIINRFGIVL